MVVVLLGITAVTSSAVGLVYRVTEAPIAQAKLHKKADALAQVLPPFDNTPADEMQAVAAGNDSVYVYTARMGQTVAGYAVESFASGFGGPIRIMVGFGPDGRIRNIQVLEQTETPGLGAKLAEEGNPVQASLLGKSPAEVKMSVRKDGGDIDAITASTISSRAYIQAVSLAYTAFLEVSGADASGWDASSGATSSRQVREEEAATSDSASGASGATPSADTEAGTDTESASAGVVGDTVSGATLQTENTDVSSGATSSSANHVSGDNEQKGKRQ